MIRLEDLLSLPRPEYAKQTELVLIDLLWRSSGSALGEARAVRGLPRTRQAGRPATRRLVLEQVGRSSTDVTETMGWVREAAEGMFQDAGHAWTFTAAAMSSIMAPRSRGDRSRTCVPVHRGVIPLQTLHGAVNKVQPPDLARAVERMAMLGGARRDGEAAALLAAAFDDVSNADFDRFLDGAAPHVWARQENANLPAWPGGLAVDQLSLEEYEAERSDAAGPPQWFWRNWTRLLDPANGWRRALPERRFADWATCLLRTGLALTYLWEGALFRALRDLRFEDGDEAWARLRAAMEEPVLLRMHPTGTPVAERDISALLSAGLGDGYFARAAFDEAVDGDLDENVGGFRFSPADDRQAVVRNLRRILVDEDEAYRDPRQAPKTLREFVRYLLLARSSNDAAPDEADFYYIARGDRRRIWVEPGPEWLVVVASLAASRPGGRCTLGDVAGELRGLGMHVDRATLVGALEGVGLTQDSPDADEAIIVNSGF